MLIMEDGKVCRSEESSMDGASRRSGTLSIGMGIYEVSSRLCHFILGRYELNSLFILKAIRRLSAVSYSSVVPITH
jgi:hypothetical protein